MSVEYEHRMNYSLLNQLLDEEYRYQCPDCASHTIAVRNKIVGADQHTEMQSHEEYHAAHHKNADIDVTVRDLRCNECHATFDRPFDKKQGTRRLIRDEHPKIGGL